MLTPLTDLTARMGWAFARLVNRRLFQWTTDKLGEKRMGYSCRTHRVSSGSASCLICGSLRGIPVCWRLINCSFGVLGAMPLLYCLRLTGRMKVVASNVQISRHTQTGVDLE